MATERGGGGSSVALNAPIRVLGGLFLIHFRGEQEASTSSRVCVNYARLNQVLCFDPVGKKQKQKNVYQCVPHNMNHFRGR